MDIYPKKFSQINTRKKPSKYNKDILIKSQNKDEQKNIFISVNKDNMDFWKKHHHHHHFMILKKDFFYKRDIIFEWESNSYSGRTNSYSGRILHINFTPYNTNTQEFASQPSILALDFCALEEAEQRQEALAEMASSGLDIDIVLWLKYLDATDINVYKYGINKLRETDINILLTNLGGFLYSNKVSMRRKIIDTLGETKNEMVIPTLCEVLLEDISPIVRIGAAKALGKIGAAING